MRLFQSPATIFSVGARLVSRLTPMIFASSRRGLTGVVTPQAAANLASVSAAAASPAGTSTGGSSGSSTQAGGTLTPAQLTSLRAQDTNAVYQQAEMLARILDFVPDLAKINNNQFAQFSVSNNEGTEAPCAKKTDI